MILSLILILILIPSSSGLSLSEGSEPAVDLKCLNDYDSEMVCYLDSGKLQNCSEYSLDVTLDTTRFKKFQCGFQLVSSDSCECQFQVPGFVISEIFIMNLWRGETFLFTKHIQTYESIKPKKPINVSVEVTKNGDFQITWIHNYSLATNAAFVESLHTNLSYSLKGSKDKVLIQAQGQTKYEIVGKNLQPNSDFVITALVSTDYNNNQIFSDESDPFEFSTPASLQSFLQIIIPITCIILILFILTIFCCFIKVKNEWWNKIPSPKIAPGFEKPVRHWATFQIQNSTPVYLDNVKLDLPVEKSWKPSSLMDVRCGNSYHSIGKSGNSSHVIYGQAGFEDAENGVDEKDVQCELLGDYQSTDHSLAVSDSSKSDDNQRVQSGNSSSFSNRCYLGSDSSGSSFLDRPTTHPAYPSDEGENPFSSLSENLDQTIPTDFEYGPCNGCSGSTDNIPNQDKPPDTETIVVFGYQSVNELQNDENKTKELPDESMNHAFISYHNDINLQVKPGCFINPQDFPFPVCESDMIVPVDEGYQSCPSFQGQNSWSSDQSADFEHNISQAVTREQEHAQSFKSVCGPVLHVSPGIEIDCSYQRV